MTMKKQNTISAAELKKGDVIDFGHGVCSRALEVLSMGDLILCQHQRTGDPKIERGMAFVFRKTEKLNLVPEVQP